MFLQVLIDVNVLAQKTGYEIYQRSGTKESNDTDNANQNEIIFGDSVLTNNTTTDKNYD